MLLLFVSVAVPAAAAGPAPTSGAITVEQPWTRATPGGSTIAVGYLRVRNAGDVPDRLVSASSEVSGSVVPHSMTMTKGVMEMRPILGGVAVPPHGTVAFAPGRDHLMFEGLKHPLKKGEHFTGTLVFQHAGPLTVTFTVESIGAKSPDGTSADHDGVTMKMD